MNWSLVLVARLVAVVLAGATLILGAFAFCNRPAPRPVPAPLATALEHHMIATAVDTAATHRLTVSAAVDAAAARRFAVERDSARRVAMVEHRRADSLAAIAAAATTAVDSAARFEAAYGARSAEVDSLQVALAASDSATNREKARGDSLARADSIDNARATRADSVLAQAVDVVQHSDPPCRLLHFFGCPSRTVVAIGAAAGAAVITAVVIKAVHDASHAGGAATDRRVGVRFAIPVP
ncbi:MAG TPA: hypothetical protein VHB25_08630 [Gemmatimonadaceae bacterium]|nr:hypothetical protein [Gemmatimonadaceae bacterium]